MLKGIRNMKIKRIIKTRILKLFREINSKIDNIKKSKKMIQDTTMNVFFFNFEAR